jgi:hypothetical protein
MKPDPAMGAVPVRGRYCLGLADFSKGIVDRSVLQQAESQAQPVHSDFAPHRLRKFLPTCPSNPPRTIHPYAAPVLPFAQVMGNFTR